MPSNNTKFFLVIVPIITRHNEQTSPIRSNPRAPSPQRHSHCGRQFIVDCCVLSLNLNGSHLRPRPHPSLLDEPSLQPGCCCCGLLARLMLLLLLLLPRPFVAATTAAAASSPDSCGCCCCSQYRAHDIAFGELVTERSFSSTVRSGKVGVRH